MFLSDSDLVSVQFSTCTDFDPPITYKNRVTSLDFSKHDFVLQDQIQQAIEERNEKLANEDEVILGHVAQFRFDRILEHHEKQQSPPHQILFE